MELPSQAARIEGVEEDVAEVISVDRVDGEMEDWRKGRSSAFHIGSLEIKSSTVDGRDIVVGHGQGRGVGHSEIESLVIYFRISTGIGKCGRIPELRVVEKIWPALVVLMYGWKCEEEVHSRSG